MANYHKRKKKMANSNKQKKRHRMSAASSNNAAETNRPAREQSSNISTVAGSTQVSPLTAQNRSGNAAAGNRIQTLVLEQQQQQQQQPSTSNPSWSTSTASSSPLRANPQPGSSATPDHSVISELTPEDGPAASESSSDEDDHANNRSQRSAGHEDEEHDLVVQHHRHHHPHPHRQHQQQVAAYRVSMNEVGVYTVPQSRTQSGFDCPPMRPDQRPQANNNQQPIIIVEPHNDDSMQCDCRQCHFFSGWFCMPCAILMIILLVVAICVLRSRGDDEHSESGSHKQSAQNSTQAAQNILSTTVSTILANSSKYLSPQSGNNNSTALLRNRLLEGAAYELNTAR